MQAISSSSSAPSKTKQFPSKSDLIARVMNEFDLYHQFEFKSAEEENDSMMSSNPLHLFQAGRAFLLKITRYGMYNSQLDHGDKTPKPEGATQEGESSMKDGVLVPPPNWSKLDATAEKIFCFSASLDLPMNKCFMGIGEDEEIAPAAKPKSALKMLRTSNQFKREHQTVVDNLVITERKGMMIECCIKISKAKFEKMLVDAQTPTFFFTCYNVMANKNKIRDLIVESELMFKESPLFMAVADFLSGTMPKKPVPKPLPMMVYEQTKDLNPSQMESILGYFNCDPFYLTIGPPGTGKSQVICKFLELCHQMNYRVLVCSMSHAAVDNVLLRFARSPYYEKWRSSNPNPSFLARFGVEHSMDPASKRFGKDFHFKSTDSATYQNKLEMFKKHSMFFATLTGSFTTCIKQLIKDSQQSFDYILVDEAAMCVDPFIFMAMTMGKKLILTGDHHQLKPIIKSTDVLTKTELGKSLFEKIVEHEKILKPEYPVSNHLTIQYRMAELIATPSSNHFYEGKVQTGPKVKSNSLVDLGALPGTILPNNTPIVWVDHNGYESEGSKNATEAEIIAKLLKDLVQKMKVQPKNIDIISAYKAQISLIKTAIKQEGLEFFDNELLIGSIDAFQGGEREVIIIATTRSNCHRNIGFLSQEERINVAATRAKRLCVFVGSSSTLIKSNSCFFAKLYDHYKKHGLVAKYDHYHKFFKLEQASKDLRVRFDLSSVSACA